MMSKLPYKVSGSGRQLGRRPGRPHRSTPSGTPRRILPRGMARGSWRSRSGADLQTFIGDTTSHQKNQIAHITHTDYTSNSKTHRSQSTYVVHIYNDHPQHPMRMHGHEAGHGTPRGVRWNRADECVTNGQHGQILLLLLLAGDGVTVTVVPVQPCSEQVLLHSRQDPAARSKYLNGPRKLTITSDRQHQLVQHPTSTKSNVSMKCMTSSRENREK